MAWDNKIEVFLDTKVEDIIEKLKNSSDMEVSDEQIKAWQEEIKFLKKHLQYINKENYLIFEYMLTEGKRPDVVIVTKNNIIILEFKTGPKAVENIKAHLDQAIDYKERLEKYHVNTREGNYKVSSYLVFSNEKCPRCSEALNLDMFNKEIDHLLMDDTVNSQKFIEWKESKYLAIPSLLNAVSEIFERRMLPDIIKSKTDINGSMESISKIIEEDRNGINIVFVAGDPGAGKTMLGISLVNKYKGRAKLLTGNGPLYNVLKKQIDRVTQKKLAGEAFIGHLPKWISVGEKNPNWEENIFIFDEAQRAWSREKNKSRSINSQPEQILKILKKYYDNNKKNVTLVCLIGNGQEIHEGEELGLDNWSDAINKIKQCKVEKFFYVSGPEVIKEKFINIDNIDNSLYLTQYLRGHEQDKYPRWCEALLSLDIKRLKTLTEELNKTNFKIYVSRSANKSGRYLKDRYGCENKYGLFASSGASRYFSNNGIKEVKDFEKLTDWFLGECNNLKTYVTEFNSQGLEVDYEILICQNDLTVKNGKWEVNNIVGRYNDKDILKMGLNKFRVLLTRCREGIILYIPEENELYKLLKACGVEEL